MQNWKLIVPGKLSLHRYSRCLVALFLLTGSLAIHWPTKLNAQAAINTTVVPGKTQLSETYLQIFCKQYAANDPSIPKSIRNLLNQTASQTLKEKNGTVWQATPHGLIKTSLDGKQQILTGKDGLPIESVTGIAQGNEGHLWLATDQGAILFMPRESMGKRSFYFEGKRYLGDNHVLNIVATRNTAWLRTESGISRIEFKPFTLEQKSVVFEERLQARHNRYGYVSGCQLLRAGDPTSFRMVPDDNDGLWTSMYLAAECFRYGTTHSPDALINARRSLTALIRLRSITGIPGFPARSLIHKGDYRDPSGEWHWTSDGEWEWKGDTSSDELAGHFFAYWVAYHLLPGEQDRAQIRATVASIAGGLIEHNFQLVGYGGRVTTWGRYDTAYLNTEDSRGRALDSSELLSHLLVAYRITGDKKFLQAYQRAANQLGYVHNMMHAEDDRVKDLVEWDEELAFLAFFPLVQAETDPTLRDQYIAAETAYWLRIRSEHNPLWNVIYAASTGIRSYDAAESLDSLERMPMSTIDWKSSNSQRADITLDPVDNPDKTLSLYAIPPNERAVNKWHRRPFTLDRGGEGKWEDDGAFYLLPYWMGRYYHLIP